MEQFYNKTEALVDPENDSLIIIPASERSIRNCTTFGCGFDKTLALREYSVIVI